MIVEITKKGPYGKVNYADPGYQKDGKPRYPIDTADHVRAAWSYINQSKNAGKYTAQQLKSIKSRIKSAAKKLGVKIEFLESTDQLLKIISLLDEETPPAN